MATTNVVTSEQYNYDIVRKFTIMTIDVHEFNKDGMVQKTWHLEDWLGGLFQMGAFEK